LDKNKEYIVDRVYLSPIINEDQDMVGIELECISMNELPAINILDEEKDYQLHFPNLSKREYEIAVLKYLGKTDKEISEILSVNNTPVSDKTITSIIYNQLYRKFNAHNKSDLINKIHSSGMDKFIPKSLIATNQLIVFSPLDFNHD
jgi:DNA-binding CsgD family transcriptional regulator